MVLLDIDHFKAVNDTHGTWPGTKRCAPWPGVVRTQLRAYDIAGRFGGEEFAVLLPHTQPAQARRTPHPYPQDGQQPEQKQEYGLVESQSLT